MLDALARAYPQRDTDGDAKKAVQLALRAVLAQRDKDDFWSTLLIAFHKDGQTHQAKTILSNIAGLALQKGTGSLWAHCIREDPHYEEIVALPEYRHAVRAKHVVRLLADEVPA